MEKQVGAYLSRLVLHVNVAEGNVQYDKVQDAARCRASKVEDVVEWGDLEWDERYR